MRLFARLYKHLQQVIRRFPSIKSIKKKSQELRLLAFARLLSPTGR